MGKIYGGLLGISFQAQYGAVSELTDRQGWLNSHEDAGLAFLFLSSEWFEEMEERDT